MSDKQLSELKEDFDTLTASIAANEAEIKAWEGVRDLSRARQREAMKWQQEEFKASQEAQQSCNEIVRMLGDSLRHRQELAGQIAAEEARLKKTAEIHQPVA